MLQMCWDSLRERYSISRSMNINDWFPSHNYEDVSICWVCGTVWVIMGGWELGLHKVTMISFATHLISFPVLKTYTIYTYKPLHTINYSHNSVQQSRKVKCLFSWTQEGGHSWWFLAQLSISKLCHFLAASCSFFWQFQIWLHWQSRVCMHCTMHRIRPLQWDYLFLITQFLVQARWWAVITFIHYCGSSVSLANSNRPCKPRKQ